MSGYMGKIAWVDLTQNVVEIRDLDTKLTEMFIGGSGVGAKILNDLTDSSTDPLGKDNIIIFMTGPLTGTIAPLSGRHQIISKSPLTGIYAESDCGGYWGTALKKSGFDGVVITGVADAPVYLWINEGKIEIRSAYHLWGMDTYELDQVLKNETHQDAVVSCIGPAGERLVPIAAVMHDGKDGRAAGRCGIGAVMGSKKLKALVAYGNQDVPIGDKKKLMELVRLRSRDIKENATGTTTYGSAGFMKTGEKLGALPVKNWSQGEWAEGAARISGEKMTETILTENYGCGACFIKCGRTVKVEKGKYAPVSGGGPEYETLGLFGSNCLVDDLEAIAKANELCNRYGLDTISTGSVISFAMEAFERGLLSDKDTNGLSLIWGNADAVISSIEKIATRSGIGELLCQGVRKTARVLGPEAEEFAVHVKGLELPAHDPRCFASNALAYVTSNRGACHLQAGSHFLEVGLTEPAVGILEGLDRFEVEGKGEVVAKMQNAMSLFDSVKACKFLYFGGALLDDVLTWYNAVTGRELTMPEFLEIGERIFNLKRMYNVKCGITSKDDILPPRMLTPQQSGGSAGIVPDLQKMLSDYYQYRGWSQDGVPTKATLERLSLN